MKKFACVFASAFAACLTVTGSGCGAPPAELGVGDGVSEEPLLLDPSVVPTAPRDDTAAEPRDRVATVSGVVVDDAGRALSGVVITVNEVTTRTGGTGAWSATVIDATRIVASFKKAGFAPVTHISDRSESDVRVTLPAVERVRVDAPLRGFTVRERAHASSLTIPPNALVSARGARPSGAVWVELYTYDVGRVDAAQPPGDGAARTATGADAAVEHVAALYSAIYDDAGVAYDLAPGAQANARIAVSAEMQSTAVDNAEAGTASYDSASASWQLGGHASLDLSAAVYTASIYKLLQIWDVNLADSGLPYCLGVRAKRETTELPMRAALYRYYGGSFVFVRNLDFNDYDKHAIYRMHENASYEVWLYTGDGNTLLQKWAVQTGYGQNKKYPPLAQCPSIELPTLHPRWPAFLSLPTTGSSATATAYYGKVDPSSLRTTLSGFKTQNGFSAQNPGVNAKFYNKNELGLGRDLTCATSGGNVACYLTKFGHPGDPPSKALHDMQANIDPGDTVAMEYSPIPGNGSAKAVKFYVYGPDGARKLSTPFDSQGEKFVPNVCIGCHAGTAPNAFNTPASANVGGVFVPVDPSTHVYSATLTRAAQEDSLRQINSWVHTQTTPQSSSIKSYIESMYPGGVDNAGSVATTFVPASFVSAGKQSIYTSIVKPYCQLCHLGRQNLDWTNYANLQTYASLIPTYVCPTSAQFLDASPMPHAFIPFRNLWAGPLGQQRVDQLLAGVGATGCVKEPKASSSGCDDNVCTGNYSHCIADDCTVCHYYCYNGGCQGLCSN